MAFKDERGQIFTKNSKGGFCNYNWTEHQMINGHPAMRASIANDKLSIYSVKRLSDGLVVTVGDKDANGDVVTKFEIIGNDIFMHKSGYCSIYNISAYTPFTPSFSFTTADGVVITDPKEKCFCIYTDLMECFIETAEIAKDTVSVTSTCMAFSTESARDNYRVLNSRCLSIQDIRDSFTMSQLEELVKSRLNK